MAPKYLQIAASLRGEIVDGVWTAGMQLPSEPQLAQAYGAAQGTVRRALAVLQAEGLVEARHGAGVFVRAFHPILRNPLRQAIGKREYPRSSIWSVEVEQQMQVDQISVAFVIDAPDEICHVLRAGDLWSRQRRYLVDERPVMVATTYLAAEVMYDAPTMDADSGDAAVHAHLVQMGLKPAYYREDLRARAPTLDEAKALDLRLGTPVIEIAQLAFTERDEAVEVTVMVMDALAYVLQYHFTS